MLEFYWSLGRDIDEMYSDAKWGTRFYDNVSKDLQSVIPNAKGLSPTNIKYMKYFYELYGKVIRPQVVDELKNLQENITFEELLSIPWGHHRSIIDKCKDNPDKAIFYIKKTIENNWSRSVLSTFLDTNLYERQGKAVTNFKYCLPKLKSDLAQELTKDPYNFDFLTIKASFNSFSS